jgi:hypothetical protein
VSRAGCEREPRVLPWRRLCGCHRRGRPGISVRRNASPEPPVSCRDPRGAAGGRSAATHLSPFSRQRSSVRSRRCWGSHSSVVAGCHGQGGSARLSEPWPSDRQRRAPGRAVRCAKAIVWTTKDQRPKRSFGSVLAACGAVELIRAPSPTAAFMLFGDARAESVLPGSYSAVGGVAGSCADPSTASRTRSACRRSSPAHASSSADPARCLATICAARSAARLTSRSASRESNSSPDTSTSTSALASNTPSRAPAVDILTRI